LGGEPEEPQEPEENVSIELSIEKQSDKIIFTADILGEVYMPNSDYWYPNGAWALYQIVDGGVKKITLDRCLAFCDTICDTGPISCETGGPSPTCQLSPSKEIFEWDRQYLEVMEKDCDNETYSCAYYSEVEPGDYKVTFAYKTDCSEGELFGENPLIIEKEFTI